MMKPEMLNFETSFNPACDSLRFLNVLDSHQGMYYKYLILPHITALLKMHLRSLSCISLLSVCLNILHFFSFHSPFLTPFPPFPSHCLSVSVGAIQRQLTCGNFLSLMTNVAITSLGVLLPIRH